MKHVLLNRRMEEVIGARNLGASYSYAQPWAGIQESTVLQSLIEVFAVLKHHKSHDSRYTIVYTVIVHRCIWNDAALL